jgi:hypothetical protein
MIRTQSMRDDTNVPIMRPKYTKCRCEVANEEICTSTLQTTWYMTWLRILTIWRSDIQSVETNSPLSPHMAMVLPFYSSACHPGFGLAISYTLLTGNWDQSQWEFRCYDWPHDSSRRDILALTIKTSPNRKVLSKYIKSKRLGVVCSFGLRALRVTKWKEVLTRFLNLEKV